MQYVGDDGRTSIRGRYEVYGTSICIRDGTDELLNSILSEVRHLESDFCPDFDSSKSRNKKTAGEKSLAVIVHICSSFLRTHNMCPL